jgi:hypothetical protein
MDLPIEFLKAYFIPGSETFLLLGLLVGVILIYSSASTRKLGDALLGALAVLYLLLSMPIVARGLEYALLDGSQPIREATEASGAQTTGRMAERSTSSAMRPACGCLRRCACSNCLARRTYWYPVGQARNLGC